MISRKNGDFETDTAIVLEAQGSKNGEKVAKISLRSLECTQPMGVIAHERQQHGSTSTPDLYLSNPYIKVSWAKGDRHGVLRIWKDFRLASALLTIP